MIYSASRFKQPVITDGRLPLSLLVLSLRSISDVTLNSWAGIVPVNALFDRYLV
jgi:hypothetical protein